MGERGSDLCLRKRSCGRGNTRGGDEDLGGSAGREDERGGGGVVQRGQRGEVRE